MYNPSEQSRAEQSRARIIVIVVCMMILVLCSGVLMYCHPNGINRVLVIAHRMQENIVDVVGVYHGRGYISTGDSTINCIGDSLTEGYKNDGISWADRLAALTQANTVNKYGIGGSTVSAYVDKNPMCVRFAYMDDDADYIVIFAGNNDFTQSVPMGEENSQDINTFYGALNVMLSGLRDKYPHGKFLYVTPLRMWHYHHPKWNEDVEYTSKNERGYTLLDYRNAIINRCEYYSIPYLDLYQQGLYGRTEKTRAAVYVDGLHPNDEGHRIIASQIAEALKRM